MLRDAALEDVRREPVALRRLLLERPRAEPPALSEELSDVDDASSQCRLPDVRAPILLVVGVPFLDAS